jgi:signal transduction histidine kinase
MHPSNYVTRLYPILHRLIALLLCLLAAPNAGASEALELHNADFVMRTGSAPPTEDARWMHLQLPDLWGVSRPGVGGDGWYRLRFSLRDVPREGQAIYLPHLCMNAAVYLNGVFLGDGGKFDDPIARNWNRPLLFLAPPSLLQTGENILLIRVNSPAFSLGSLYTVYVGPESELRPEYEAKFFWRITFSQTISLVIAAMGLFMLALWHRRRQDAMYGYFGLSALVWSLYSSNQFIRSIPVSARLWETLVNASVQIFVSLLMLSLLRFLGLQQRLLERVLWLILIASPLCLLLAPDKWLLPVSMFWHLATLFSSIAVGWFLLRAAVRMPNQDTLPLIGALCLSIVFGIHDWLRHASFLPEGDTHWLQYGAPMFFLAAGGTMANRFARALNQFEQSNADLEQRMRDKHAELETQFADRQDMEKQRATMDERNRIYRDLHDDMGAKLLSLVISAQRANQPNDADLARSALQDLRDVVSRSAQDTTPLGDLLADWRMEIEQRVHAAGLKLDWRFPEEETGVPVSTEAALNLSRILREAVTNILRHAQARRINIITQIDGMDFCFIVEDDGIGFSAASLKPHRGMTGMQARAASLGATLDWQPIAPHGCRMEFRVPSASLTP